MTLYFAVPVILISGFFAFSSIVPFLKIPHGLVRGPEFLRLQILALSAVLVPVAVWAVTGPWLWFCLVCLFISIAVGVGSAIKFTPLWSKQSFDADPDLMADTDRHLSVVTANVKMSNRDYDKLISLARRERPDILAAIETDQKWIDALAVLKPDHLHHVEVPYDTGYGLALYSRYPLKDTEICSWITEGVPSIRTTVTLPCGDDIRLYIVHPEPPIASHSTTGRDSEIAAAGLAATEDNYPSIVAGDLNDVAWSSTTRRFQRITGMLDPRVGRGFFNTFSAFYPMFRWPLDHLFHEESFRLVSMKRLEPINSDHFPISFTLALAYGEEKEGDAPPPADDEETEEVEEMIEEEKQIDRDPIGTDWEDED